MSTEKLIRVTTFANRKKGLSKQEFHKYWAQEHGHLIAEWLERWGVVKYVQYHATPEFRDLGKSLGNSGNQHAIKFDAMADFYVRDFEDLKNAFDDPEYLERIRPDEEKFVDMDTLTSCVGFDWVMMEDGKENVEHEERNFD